MKQFVQVRIHDVLRASDVPLTWRQVHAAAGGYSASTVRGTLNTLYREGRVDRVPNPDGSDAWWRYVVRPQMWEAAE